MQPRSRIRAIHHTPVHCSAGSPIISSRTKAVDNIKGQLLTYASDSPHAPERYYDPVPSDDGDSAAAASPSRKERSLSSEETARSRALLLDCADQRGGSVQSMPQVALCVRSTEI